MITLASDCLLFEVGAGETIPYSADMVAVELEGHTAKQFDSDFVQHATNAVFHYFKHELGRQTVSLGEFVGALEKVLGGFAAPEQPASETNSRPGVAEFDLHRLAGESGPGSELFFFPRLRAELQRHLRQGSRVLRFRGLRDCVKYVAGTRRWGLRCQGLEGEIVDYLRQCLSAESAPKEIALVVK